MTPTCAGACKRFVRLLESISFNIGEANGIIVSLRREAVRIQRVLFVKTPLNEQDEFARLLVNLSCALKDNGRPQRGLRCG